MKWTLLLLFVLVQINCFEQGLPTAFKEIPIDKKLKEFKDTMDLSSPLKSFISISYIMANGRNRLWRKVSTQLFTDLPDSTAPDTKLSDEKKDRYLNSTIKLMITYKDSLARIISQLKDTIYLIRCVGLENGKWINWGEDYRRSLDAAKERCYQDADYILGNLRKSMKFAKIPTDTLSFVDYLNKRGRDSKEFVLEKLKQYRLVLYGEIHRRKVSWDFLQQVVGDKRFPDKTGVIFMELGSNKQQEMDQFYANKSIDRELLLNIFKDYMIDGWDDKGKFDFLISVWNLNQGLPENKKIKVVLVDTPRIFTEEGRKSDTIDRNQFMAQEIFDYLGSNKDRRNALFIVGSGHVLKSLESAGSLLSKKMPSDCYMIFTHCPRMDNIAIIHDRIRHGMFDYAFYKHGDIPVAFDLKGSPFGKEPFDGLYLDGWGSYQDNFDGYIFLGSLDKEPNGELLLDMYDENFIKEIDRRYKLYGGDFLQDWGLTELSRKAVIDKILSEQTKTRWEDYIKPLKNGKINGSQY